MRQFTLAAMALSAAAFGLGTATRPLHAATATKLSGPFVHDNLAVYFIHGESASGPIPLTLSEALAKGTIKVRETGSVNSLEIENTGTADVFIQAGDIVKGGQQDRVLMMSMILPAKSGKIPIGSFCVEQGRWSKRGAEDVKQFASSHDALPSRVAKLAMKAPEKPVAAATTGQTAPPLGQGQTGDPGRGRLYQPDETSKRQGEVWAAVSGVQGKLSAKLGAPVAAPQSASSLQLSLENEKLKATRQAYITSLQDKAKATDIIGYVFAVNGHINSADQYPSSGLFQKMWPKLLAASATEALGEDGKLSPGGAAGVPQATDASTAPTTADVAAFLAQAETGTAQEKPLGTLARQELRDTDKALYVEARRTDGSWVHRNYLAK